MQNPASIVGQHDEHEQDSKRQGGHDKEVQRYQLLEMILQEGAPSLRGRLAMTDHVLAHARLPYVDTKLEQLAVDAWCAPARVGEAYLAD